MANTNFNILYNGKWHELQVEDPQVINILETDPVATEQFMRSLTKQNPEPGPQQKNSEPGTQHNADSKVWPDEMTLAFIALVKEHQKELDTGVKKNVWSKIATKLNGELRTNYSITQIETKWKSLVRTYKDVKRHNDSTGNKKKNWKFWLVMNELLFQKPEILAPATCSSGEGLIIHNLEGTNNNNHTAIENDEDTENWSHTSSFQKKRAIKQNAIAKRHSEKMAKIDLLNKSIQELITVIKDKKS